DLSPGTSNQTQSPSNSWSFQLGTPSVVGNAAGVPTYPWFPDGNISVLRTADNSRWLMFWPEWESYRTVGASQFPEDQTALAPFGRVFGGATAPNGCGWDNGGSWLMSVHRVGAQLIAFYHAEDHWCGGVNPGIFAYKSMAWTVSSDDGVTWQTG